MEIRPAQKYGQAYTLNFNLYEVDGVDFRTDASFAAGDVKIMKDNGAEANTTNLPSDEGQGYSLVLTATEMQAARIVIYIVDQTSTKVWLDIAIAIETYGNASAQHAFDLDTASTAQTGDSYARLGAPAGASIAADLVTIDNLVDDLESRLTAIRAGYLDNLNGHTAQTGDSYARLGAPAGASIAADLVTIDNLVDDLESRLTAIRAGYLDNLNVGGDVASSAEIGALNDLSAAEVNAQVSDVMKTDTISEMTQGAPPATPTFEEAVMYVYMALRNELVADASGGTNWKEFKNDAGTVIWKKQFDESGSVYTENEGVSGP
jgi:hypothetical protein